MLDGFPGALVWDTGKRILLSGQNLKLYEYNWESGEVEFFDKNPTCSHTTDECPAGNPGTNIEAVNGRVAMLRHRVQSGTWGSRNNWISVLQNGRFEFVAGPVECFRGGPDGWYAITPDGSLVRFPFEGGEPELLVDEFRVTHLLILGDFLYGMGEEGLVRVPRAGGPTEILYKDTVAYNTDGEQLYVGLGNGLLSRVDMDGRNPETVTDMPDVYPTTLCFDDTYIYFKQFDFENREKPGNGGIYRLPKDLSAAPELLGNIGSGVLKPLPSLPGKLLVWDAVSGSQRYWLLDTDTRELTELVLP
jgi:hypothetical protein